MREFTLHRILWMLTAVFSLSAFAVSPVVINEILAGNSHTNYDPDYKQFSDWIELYNNSSSAVNVGGYYLSDDPANPTKWRIPSHTIAAHGYYLIWCDKENSGNHTNFKLSQDGETVTLSDSSGNAIHSITYPQQESDISYSQINGSDNFMLPTPNTANATGQGELKLSKKPTFSLDSGFYTGTQSLTLSQENGGEIYYTTDGSIPTENSHRYTQPIQINKTTVIRARSKENGKFMSKIKNRTYLIDESITLPVVSIAINSEYFYGSHGIYENYEEDWMRAGSVEYFKDGQSQFSENIGVRIYGNYSRAKPQKSLAIFVKDQYGPKSIKYPLFPDKPQITNVKSFILRNSGNDWEYSFMRDGLFHTLIKDTMDIDYLSYHPTVVFINGQYWGVENLREKPNEDYLEANHGIDPDNVDILMGEEKEVLEGDGQDYQALLNFVTNHSLANDGNYHQVENQIDIDELINYLITEIYVGNTDWPAKNNKYWKEKVDGAKWRWILYDTDFGFGLMNEDHVEDDTFSVALRTDREVTTIFRKLMENETFKKKFTTRFTTHLNTTFLPSRVNQTIGELKNVLEPEMSRHYAYWRQYKDWIGKSLWEDSVQSLYDYSNARNTIVRRQLQNRFNLHGSNILTIPQPSEGNIEVDGVRLDQTYNGEYFDNATVTLKATPKEGYEFVRWSNGATTPEIEVTFHGDMDITAEFAEAAPAVPPKIVINEINYKSESDHDSGDWIELYNNDTTDVDLSGWMLKDEDDTHSFTIPAGTILHPQGYLVITEDQSAFQSYFPDVTNVTGDTGFGFGKKSDSVRLFDTQDNLADSVTYDENWPDAKGNGKTLSLTDPESDNALPENWKAATPYGTPGKKNQSATVSRDFNADHRSDILWRNKTSGMNYLYLMNGKTIQSEGTINTVSDLNWEIAGTGDFNGDSKADILWRNQSTGMNYLYMMDGDTIQSEGVINTVIDMNWKIVGTADFNGDQKADILWRNQSTGMNYLYEMDGTTIVSSGVINTVADTNWNVVGTGDFDQDGKADILWRNDTTGMVYLYLMDGKTIKDSGVVSTVADMNWKIVGTGDHNGDGKADILWRNTNSGVNYLYMMDGKTIQRQGIINTVADQNWKIADTGDHNGDGKADILWRNSSTGMNYLYFMNGTTITSQGMVNTVSDQNWQVVNP